ncbi:inovirus-type Gp2 protein [Psychrobacter immobilis]|uniref:YagK/YfjJ domain-containing protein n=1 Tax=Psychrobacter immobilis TaxID=498 RepID=UPI001D1058C3|nr:inovirus-type Gp2 protein [Psychrobacter immobilis]
MIIPNLSHEMVVAKVDKLVSDILKPNTRISIQQINEQLNLYYQPMTLLYNNDLEYVNSIKWFIGSCYIVCDNYYPNEVIWDEATTQRFLQALIFYQYEYATAMTDFAFQEQRNRKSLLDYINYFLEKYTRVLIVRVDVKIKSEFSHLVSVETFQGFMNQLMKAIQRDKETEKKRKTNSNMNIDKGCFEDLRGYAWAIEQGVDNGGLHCHLVLIYNADKRQQDWYLGEAVGKRWVEITEGLGWYNNGNTTECKREYKRRGTLGVGMIHRDNLLEVKNAIYAALYLTRPDKYGQRLKAWTPNMRTFGHGTYRTKKRRGLPPIAN